MHSCIQYLTPPTPTQTHTHTKHNHHHKKKRSLTSAHRPDSVLGIMVILNQLIARGTDGFNTVSVGLHLSLKVLMFL